MQNNLFIQYLAFVYSARKRFIYSQPTSKKDNQLDILT